MSGKPSPAMLERCFATLEDCAAKGLRCPFNRDFTGPPEISGQNLSALAREKRIRVEIGKHNWRVVVVLQGPHAGKHTAHPPNERWRPYKIVTDEVRVNGAVQAPYDMGGFRAPSKPRAF
jgi:hypothetical protein